MKKQHNTSRNLSFFSDEVIRLIVADMTERSGLCLPVSSQIVREITKVAKLIPNRLNGSTALKNERVSTDIINWLHVINVQIIINMLSFEILNMFVRKYDDPITIKKDIKKYINPAILKFLLVCDNDKKVCQISIKALHKF